MVFSACLLLASAAMVPAQQPVDTPSNTSDQKTKKVRTNDDLAPGNANATPSATMPRRYPNKLPSSRKKENICKIRSKPFMKKHAKKVSSPVSCDNSGS
jgi:hypothetical protein